MSVITLEFLQNLLAEDYPDVEIKEFEGVPGSKRGDNYTSMVYRISLKGVRRGSGSEEPWQGSIVYKRLPESVAMREAYKSDELFCNEVAFYTKIWPEFQAFQAQWERVKTPFKAIPKCYLAQNDMVILKDLKQLGFVMPDRRQELSMEQAYFLLRHLAHFHALSLAMKYNNPERFYELVNSQDGITEVFFVAENAEYYRAYYAEAIRNALAMVAEELADRADRARYLDAFRSFCHEETFFRSMVQLARPQEPLAVITHGDCWTNNLLFRYADGDIAELCMVDFQLVRYASPALDLASVAYLCLGREQRSHHLGSLLEYYTDQLHERLLEMSNEDSIFYTTLNRDSLYKQLQADFRRVARFGLGLALDMYPIMSCDSDEAPNLYQKKESGSAPASHWDMKPVRTASAACRRKMADLVCELVDQGLL